MRVCPKCGKLLSYNSYFGAFICEGCNWEDASKDRKREVCYVLKSADARKLKETYKVKKMAVAR